MDLSQILGAIPAALAPIALVLFFSNENTKRWMDERRETVLAILGERKEWAQERKDILERQFMMQERSVTATTSAIAENHAFRNALTANTNRLEALDLRIQALSKGSSGNDQRP